MIEYLLDTDTAIALIKGREETTKRLRERKPGEVAISSVTKAELFYGARKSERTNHNLGVLSRFFAPFPSLVFDDRASEEYGLIRADLERAGNPIGPNDLLIAALARARDLTLVSFNVREFDRVIGLKVASW